MTACALAAVANAAFAAPASAQLSGSNRLYMTKTTTQGAPLAGAQFSVRFCNLSADQSHWAYRCTASMSFTSGADGTLTAPTTGFDFVGAYGVGVGAPYGPVVAGYAQVTEVVAPTGYQRTPGTRYFASTPEEGWMEVKGTPNLLALKTGDTNVLSSTSITRTGRIGPSANGQGQSLSWPNSLEKASPQPTTTPTTPGASTSSSTAEPTPKTPGNTAPLTPGTTQPATPWHRGTATNPSTRTTGPKVQTDYGTPLETTAPLLIGGLLIAKITTHTLGRRQKNKRS